eukprot:4915690-Amphidinium_carterae.1
MCETERGAKAFLKHIAATRGAPCMEGVLSIMPNEGTTKKWDCFSSCDAMDRCGSNGITIRNQAPAARKQSTIKIGDN